MWSVTRCPHTKTAQSGRCPIVRLAHSLIDRLGHLTMTAFWENSTVVAPSGSPSRRSPRTEGRVYTSQAMQRAGDAPKPRPEAHRETMAVYVVRMQVIGRSAGRSATAAAAYRSGEQVRDERTGKVHDYTGKTDIYDSEILKPENAPSRLSDRTSLWNEVEKMEKRKDAQLSREFLVALPAELNHHQRQELTRDFVQNQFVDKGMIADIGYHDFNSHNPHAHIMLTMRSVDEDGFGKKQREWNKREQLQQQREAWARHANAHLERAGYEARIDHRSLKEQGSDRQPQPKLGPAVANMEAKGIRTEKGNEFRRVNKENRNLERKQTQCEKLQSQIAVEDNRERVIAQAAEPKIKEQPVEKQPKLVQRREQPKQHRKPKAEERDQGFEY